MARDYRVGYRKPPPHTRFKKGQSGNPKGRPKGTKNLASELREELAETILVKEGGVTKRVSKGRAMIKRQVEQGLRGDPRALSCVFALARAVPASNEEAEPDLSPEDRAIIERFIAKHTKNP